MPNVTISDLPDAILPLDSPNTFFEVQTVESGVVVSRKVTADDIVITASEMIIGNGVADPTGGLPYDYDATLTFENANAEFTSRLGWNGASIFELENLSFGASIVIAGKTAAGSKVQAMAFNPSGLMTLNQGSVDLDANGEVELIWDALGTADVTFRLTTDGAILHRPSGPSPNDLRLLFTEGTFITVTNASIGFDSSDIFTVDGLGAQTIINSNSSSGVGFSHMGVQATQTLIGGYKVFGSLLDLDNDQLDALTRLRARNSTGGLDLRVLAGGDAAITQLAGVSGGFEDDWINLARNLGVTINHNNVAMARSVAIGSGGFEVNNTVTGGGFERVLTTADLAAGSLAGLSDVDISGVNTGDILYKSAGDWLDTGSISLNPGTLITMTDDLLISQSNNELLTFESTVGSGLDAVLELSETGNSSTFSISFEGEDFISLAQAGNVIIGSLTTAGIIFLNRGTSKQASLGTNTFVIDVDTMSIGDGGASVQLRWLGGTNGSLVGTWTDSSESFLFFYGSAGGAFQESAMTMVRDGAITLYHDNVTVARTLTAAAGGLEANNTLTGGGFERVLTTSDGASVPDPLTIGRIIVTDSAPIDLVDTDVALNVGGADPDNDPHLELGFGVFGPGIQAKLDATTIDVLEINRLGGDVNIGSSNNSVAGTVRLNVSNGATSSTVIECTSSGIILEGITGANTILDFHTPGGNLVMRQVFNGANLQFDGFLNSLEYQFQSRSSGGTIRQMLHMDPDADVEIYHPPSAAIVIETHTPATGGAFVNNTLTGAGLERVLTESDLAASDIGLSDTRTSAVGLTTASFVNILTVLPEVNHNYFVHAQLNISSPAADDAQVDFTLHNDNIFEGTLTNSNDNTTTAFDGQFGDVSTSDVAVQTDGSAQPDGSYVTIEGILKVGANTTSFVLRAGKGLDTGADGQVGANGAYLILIPINQD